MFLAENYVFPVTGFHIENNIAVTDNIYGTASYLNNRIFITAAHSIKNALQNNHFGISFKEGLNEVGKLLFNDIVHFAEDYELFEDYDLGLIKLKSTHPNAIPYQWDLTQGMMFEHIQTIGFPHGFDFFNKKTVTRALKGHIVCSTDFDIFPSHPLIYELSFHCPKGISGAPLTSERGEPPRAKGYIIGNRDIEIMTFSSREINEENGEKLVYEKYETTKFGVAIQLSNLMPINSRLLGCTFKEYLEREDLIYNKPIFR